jgi:plasmid maintenance system antidote protein VapI
MEQKQLGRRGLEPATGSRARVAEVLNRRRALTLPMIRRLSRLLDIPADLLTALQDDATRAASDHKTGGSAQRRRPAHAPNGESGRARGEKNALLKTH